MLPNQTLNHVKRLSEGNNTLLYGLTGIIHVSVLEERLQQLFGFAYNNTDPVEFLLNTDKQWNLIYLYWDFLRLSTEPPRPVHRTSV